MRGSKEGGSSQRNTTSDQVVRVFFQSAGISFWLKRMCTVPYNTNEYNMYLVVLTVDS
jgi:hypothetical protein